MNKGDTYHSYPPRMRVILEDTIHRWDQGIFAARRAVKEADMEPLPCELPLSPPGRLLWITDLDDIPPVLHFAIQYAARLNVKTRLLHVLESSDEPLSLESPPSAIRRTDQMLSHAIDVLEKAAAEVRAAGIDCDWQIATSPLTVSLREVGEAWSPDRILRVRRGRGLREDLDSATETVLREAVVPVFVLDAGRVPTVFRYPANILFPTSLDRRALEIAAGVIRFAHAHGAEITMLHVIDGASGRGSWIQRVRACATEQFRALLEGLGGIQIETMIELGDIAETVARIAQPPRFDLIFLSAFSGISFRSDIRPGAAYKILSNARCPVLVYQQDVISPLLTREQESRIPIPPFQQ